MTGIILATLYAAWKCAVSHAAVETVYLNATNFLFWWYVVWGVIWGCAVSLILLFLIVAIGVNRGYVSKIRVLLEMGGVGVLSALITFRFAARQALYIGGAYLLNTALTQQNGAYQWEIARLIIGGLCLVIALLTKKGGISLSQRH